MKARSGHFKRALMGAFALFGAVVAQPGFAASDWKPNSDDAVLLDARLGKYRLGEGIRGYATPDGVCVDLADTIMTLDLPVRLDKKLRRATGWAFDERRTITLDREANTVQIMNKMTHLAAGDVYDAPEGWCVSVKRLSDWLGVTLDADQTNAVLMIKSDTRLPVEMAIERRNRAAKIRPSATFDLASLPQARTVMKGISPPSLDVVMTASTSRSNGRSALDHHFGYEIYAAGEIGPVAYDARLAGNKLGSPESLRVKAYRIDPDATMLGPLNATQVAVGDVSGFSTPLVAQSGAGRGGFITNRPLQMPASFDRTDFRGELPSGWDAELYRNGELLAFASNRADGRYEFLDVPLSYGQNRFEVVLYGPQGQVRREERSVSVGADSIPPRQTWYWAGVVQEGHDLIRFGSPYIARRSGWRATAGFERGIDTMTSVSAYAHRLTRLDGTTANYGEVSLRRTLGPMLAEFSGATSFKGGTAVRAQVFGQLGRTNFEVESILARGGFQSDRIYGIMTGIHEIAVDHAMMLGKTMVPMRGEARIVTYANGDQAREAGFRTSASIGRMSVTGRLDWRSHRNKIGPDPEDRLESSVLANARIGRVRVRTEARFRLKPEARFESVDLVGEWGGRESGDRHGGSWRAEIGYEGPNKRLRGAIGYVRQFKKVALTASLGAGSDGALSAGLNLAFSLGADPARPGHIRMTSDRLATQGQVLATIYRDMNGDGIRQPDEPAEPDVQLTAGRVPVDRLSDAKGQVIVDGIQPYQAVLIGVDGSTLPDPMVQPSGPGMVIHPRPGIVSHVELPLVSAGEVDGTLVRSGGSKLEGVDLELVDAAGVVMGRTRTEYDGYFLFESVPYGRYSVRVANLSAEAARIRPQLAGAAIVSGKTPIARLGMVEAEAQVQRAQGP